MRPSFFKQLRILIPHFLRLEWANKDRILGTILFAATVLALFFFAFGDIEQEMSTTILVAQTFLTAFFALQISFSRVFEPEQADNAFLLMRSYPISGESWFLAKFATVLLFGLLVLCSTILISSFLSQKQGPSLISFELFAIALLAIAGLAAIGVLLSAMMLQAAGRQLLYPLIYFPLTTPVLLAAVQSSLEVLQNGAQIVELMPSWLGLLCIFDVIYITLSILLYGELLKSD